jgi:lysophospholipase L1-like esterase
MTSKRADGLSREPISWRTLLTMVIVVLLLGASTVDWGGDSAATASAGPHTRVAPHTITLAYAGDSTTAQPDSWLEQLDDSRIVTVGGYAHSGYTSEQVLQHIHRVDADVLVVMVGINDFRFAASDNVDTVVADVNLIVRKVHARRQVISAVAPSNITSSPNDGADAQKLQTALNRALEKDAAHHHWTWIDPYSRIRDQATGGYVNQAATLDGIHPSSLGYAIVSAELDATITNVARSLPASR